MPEGSKVGLLCGNISKTAYPRRIRQSENVERKFSENS